MNSLRSNRTNKKTPALQGLFLILVCFMLGTGNAHGQNAATEEQIKAAYLLKFPTYIEWPVDTFSDAGTPLVFGILDAGSMAGNLEQISKGLAINGRPVEVRRLQAADSLDGVHVLFIGKTSNADIAALLPAAAGMSILTVTEAGTPRPDGSIINFEVLDNRVRFDVALIPAEQGGLKLSSRLLQVAQRIVGQSR